MVWGEDGNPMLLRGDFDRRLEEEGLTTNRSRTATPFPRSNSSLSWTRKSSLPSLAESSDSMDSVSEMKDEREYREEVEVGDVDRRPTLVSRAGARIKRIVRNTGEVGLKIVGLPAFVLLDIVS